MLYPARSKPPAPKVKRKTGKTKPLPAFLRDSDVLLVSYPRSGNTWMRYLLANLMFPDMRWHIDNLNRAVPDLGETFPEQYLSPEPRIYKTHSPLRHDRCRAIYLYRDGRDVAISFYDRRRKLRGYDGSFEQFLEEILLGEMKFDSWQGHIKSWISGVTSGQVLAICYEDMCRDLADQMHRVGDFLGLRWSDNEIERAARRSSRRRLRRHYRKYLYRTYWKKGFTGGVNKGSGYWRQQFSPEQKELFWNYAGETASMLGYPRD